MSFDAGAITGSLELDISHFAHGMIEATSISELFPEVVRSFMANPLLGLIDLAEEAAKSIREAFESTSEAVHALGVESIRAGVSAQFLEGLGDAARSQKVGIEEIAHSMAFLNRNIAEAASGNKDVKLVFDQL